MVWCGFDEMMRSGMGVYADGVARAIKTKAESSGIPVAQQLAQERVELKTLETLINRRLDYAIDDPSTILVLRAFEGLVSVARFLIEKESQAGALAEDDLCFEADGRFLGSLIESFDKVFTTLRQEDGHPKNAAIALNRVIPVRDTPFADANEPQTLRHGREERSLAPTC
jgi:hypothetical protein